MNPWYHPRRIWAATQLAVILLATVALAMVLSLGRVDLSGALWFQALVAILAVNGAVCTIARLPRLARRFRRDPLRVVGTLAVHLGLFLLLGGLLLSGLVAWRETTPALAVGQTAALAHAGLRVRCDDVQVHRDEAGRLRDARANLMVLAGDVPLVQGAVRVGEPLTARGIGLHLHGYIMQGAEPAAIIQAVYDPGFGPVVAGATLGTVGAALGLWARPRRSTGEERADDGD